MKILKKMGGGVGSGRASEGSGWGGGQGGCERMNGELKFFALKSTILLKF